MVVVVAVAVAVAAAAYGGLVAHRGHSIAQVWVQAPDLAELAAPAATALDCMVGGLVARLPSFDELVA